MTGQLWPQPCITDVSQSSILCILMKPHVHVLRSSGALPKTQLSFSGNVERFRSYNMLKEEVFTASGIISDTSKKVNVFTVLQASVSLGQSCYTLEQAFWLVACAILLIMVQYLSLQQYSMFHRQPRKDTKASKRSQT